MCTKAGFIRLHLIKRTEADAIQSRRSKGRGTYGRYQPRSEVWGASLRSFAYSEPNSECDKHGTQTPIHPRSQTQVLFQII